MKAIDHTRAMLRWWLRVGVQRADLAVRRHNCRVIWHRDRSLRELPLSWARQENTRFGDVYIRPARGYRWSVVFLDDVETDLAARIATKYPACVVRTSQVGGCHVWLKCDRDLDEQQRKVVQRWLAEKSSADLASTSGEHLGRLAGVKNWKRKGNWVNVLETTFGRPWDPSSALEADVAVTPRPFQQVSNKTVSREKDVSPSAREWGWVCGALEAGVDPARVLEGLCRRVQPRRGRDTERYARRTVQAALSRIRARVMRGKTGT